jgi:hypothetical protein
VRNHLKLPGPNMTLAKNYNVPADDPPPGSWPLIWNGPDMAGIRGLKGISTLDLPRQAPLRDLTEAVPMRLLLHEYKLRHEHVPPRAEHPYLLIGTGKKNRP